MWPESNWWLHQESHSSLSQTVHSVQKEIIRLSRVSSCFHTKDKKIQNLSLNAFKPQMLLPGHVLNNVCAHHQLPWFITHVPPHLFHTLIQAWHFNIQDLYKRIRTQDPNCFVTLFERLENATSLCQFYHDHKETLTYPWGQVRSGICVLEEWRT